MNLPIIDEMRVVPVPLKGSTAMWDVVWYKITYKEKKGWVSEFDTDKAPKELRKGR
jgi:hypothetical protein